jgi:hypothetical protein
MEPMDGSDSELQLFCAATPNGTAPSYLPLAELAAACQAETRKFLRDEPHDDVFALELLSRAVRAGDDSAWEAFVAQYSGLVLAQIRRHPPHSATAEDDTFWINRTFQRFAEAVTADRLDLFPSMAAVLRYLQMCAHSVLMDQERARRRWPHTSLEPLRDTLEAGHDVERSVVGRLAAQELWDAVIQELPDASERLIACLSFKGGYKPAEIHARHSDRFPNIADVYRIKRNVLVRLRRSPRLQCLRA